MGLLKKIATKFGYVHRSDLWVKKTHDKGNSKVFSAMSERRFGLSEFSEEPQLDRAFLQAFGLCIGKSR